MMIPFNTQLLFLITGALIFAEALALAIAVFIVKKGLLKWNTLQNKLMLLFDLLFGLVIVLSYWLISKNGILFLVGFSIGISTILHIARTIEFLIKSPNPFCANRALFWLNNAKFLLLVALMFTMIP